MAAAPAPANRPRQRWPLGYWPLLPLLYMLLDACDAFYLVIDSAANGPLLNQSGSPPLAPAGADWRAPPHDPPNFPALVPASSLTAPTGGGCVSWGAGMTYIECWVWNRMPQQRISRLLFVNRLLLTTRTRGWALWKPGWPRQVAASRLLPPPPTPRWPLAPVCPCPQQPRGRALRAGTVPGGSGGLGSAAG